MTTDEKYMQAALEEAREAARQDEIPIGAVVECGGKIISRGHNMVEMLQDPTAHAEMIALTAATEYLGGKYLTDCTIYVTVEPCPMCAAALNWAQVKRVVWGADDPKRGFSLFSAAGPAPQSTAADSAQPAGSTRPDAPQLSLLHPRTVTTKGVLAHECSQIVSEFFKSKR